MPSLPIPAAAPRWPAPRACPLATMRSGVSTTRASLRFTPRNVRQDHDGRDIRLVAMNFNANGFLPLARAMGSPTIGLAMIAAFARAREHSRGRRRTRCNALSDMKNRRSAESSRARKKVYAMATDNRDSVVSPWKCDARPGERIARAIPEFRNFSGTGKCLKQLEKRRFSGIPEEF